MERRVCVLNVQETGFSWLGTGGRSDGPRPWSSPWWPGIMDLSTQQVCLPWTVPCSCLGAGMEGLVASSV